MRSEMHGATAINAFTQLWSKLPPHQTSGRGVFHTEEWMDFVLSTVPRSEDGFLGFTSNDALVAFCPIGSVASTLGRRSWSHAHEGFSGLLLMGERSLDAGSRKAVILRHTYGL